MEVILLRVIGLYHFMITTIIRLFVKRTKNADCKRTC